MKPVNVKPLFNVLIGYTCKNCFQVLFLVEMSDGSAEEASCQMPLSVDVKKEPNDVTTTNSNDGSDACECNCHGNQTVEACENSKSNPVTDCRHCQLQRCLLFKDFSKVWSLTCAVPFKSVSLCILLIQLHQNCTTLVILKSVNS